MRSLARILLFLSVPALTIAIFAGLYLESRGQVVSKAFESLSPSRDCEDVYQFKTEIYTSDDIGILGPRSLEQRAIVSDVIVRARVLSDEVNVVRTNYTGFTYTLFHEFELEVFEYLRGGGPDRITVIMEGQYVASYEEDILCLKDLYEGEVELYGHDSIIFLDTSSERIGSLLEPGQYYLGLAFDTLLRQNPTQWAKWFFGGGQPGSDTFLDPETDDLIKLDELRQRIASVIEESDREDHPAWRDCVERKYYLQGKPRIFQGFPVFPEEYRNHRLYYGGVDAPVLAGTTIWEQKAEESVGMWLEGRDANKFDITFYEEFLYTHKRMLGFIGDPETETINWYVVKPGSFAAERQPQYTASGYVITAAENLNPGDYFFYLHIRNKNAVDCGQDPGRYKQFRIVVTEAPALTEPPSPSNIQLYKDRSGWLLTWDPIQGVERYSVTVYRPGR